MSLHEAGCAVDAHHFGPCLDDRNQVLPMSPKPVPGRPPQPTAPGPLHAVVRGPGGLDISISGEPGIFGRLLEAVGDAISAALGD